MDAWLTSPCQAFGHGGRVFGLAYHPFTTDVIASASEDETVRVWRRCQASASWEQTSCCRGHTAEVLRVGWSPDGRLLASGSADRTVRLWQVGISEEQSYAGLEVATLGGHPEEVYGVKFLQDLGSSSSSSADQQQQQPAAAGSSLLVSCSGETVFLWDLAVGEPIAQSSPPPPPPPTAAMASLAVAGTAQQQQQQQEDEEDLAMPSFIFGLAVAEGTNWLAGTCSDGLFRLWDASKRSLLPVAAVQAHGGEMGSCCAFVPQQPWLVQSLSKRGQLVLLDLRLLTRPLLMQELEGPVFDATWVFRQPPPQPSLAAAAEGGMSGSNGSPAAATPVELWLAVVGRDHCMRCYQYSPAALAAGRLAAAEVVPMTSGYSGRLLAVAAARDRSCMAAAGEAVPAQTLTPWRPQQQQQQHEVLRRVGGAAPANGSRDSVAAAAVAAAATAAAGGGRRGRGRKVAVNILEMADDDELPLQQQQQQQQQQRQQQANGHAAVAAAAGQAQQQKALQSTDPEAAAEAAEAWLDDDAAGAEAAMPACAAMSDVLVCAPMFTWRCYGGVSS